MHKSEKKIQSRTDWWNELTEKQLHEIKKGISDIKHGRIISSEKVWQRYGRNPKP